MLNASSGEFQTSLWLALTLPQAARLHSTRAVTEFVLNSLVRKTYDTYPGCLKSSSPPEEVRLPLLFVHS